MLQPSKHSGAQKRHQAEKTRKKISVLLSKIPKLSTFFTSASDNIDKRVVVEDSILECFDYKSLLRRLCHACDKSDLSAIITEFNSLPPFKCKQNLDVNLKENKCSTSHLPHSLPNHHAFSTQLAKPSCIFHTACQTIMHSC